MELSFQEQIFQTFGFKVPESYAELLAKGQLQYGEGKEDWEQNYRTLTMTRPPALLCSAWHTKVEWKPPDAVLSWSAPDDWLPNEFVAFAGNGYGDEWVWDAARTIDGKAAVVLCRHDEDESTVFANSFEDFLFRILLEAFAEIALAEAEDLNADPESYMKFLRLNIATVEPYISPDQARFLAALLDDFKMDQEKQESYQLISEEDKQAAIRRLMVGTVDQTFEHLE